MEGSVQPVNERGEQPELKQEIDGKPRLRLIDLFFRGINLVDLYANDQCGIGLIRSFFTSVWHTMTVLDRQEIPIGFGYNDIVIKSTRAKFRLTLKYLLHILFLALLDTVLKEPSKATGSPLLIALLCCPILVAYLATMHDLAFTTYQRLSTVIAYLSTTAIVAMPRTDLSYLPGRNSMGLILLVCLIVLLPLRSDQCAAIAVMYIATIIGLRLFTLSLRLELLQRYDIVPDPDGLAQSVGFGVFIQQLIAWLPILCIGFYLRFWNTVRCKLAFYKLGQSVEARQNASHALTEQLMWIDAIVPRCTRDEYYSMRRQHAGDQNHWWIFSKPYDNVSILFADIVGFTRMSSLTSPSQVVAMLNNLFYRFDDLCNLTQCEKLGTLGDCYYCVAGCPTPHPDHVMRCVEMGLGMCRIIKVFNCDFGQSVNMRIGVHTGRVNAAIIGSQRFRFDVYSYDVIIASALESSGRPGRVHVSQQVFDRVSSIYNFSPGDPLEVKVERVSGIAGMELAMAEINTYFVDPRSTQWRVKHEKFGRNLQANALPDPGQAESRYSLKSEKDARRSRTSFLSGTTNLEQSRSIKKDSYNWSVRLMQDIWGDSEKQYELFNNLPISQVWMRFTDPEIEWHYKSHALDSSFPAHVDSYKVHPLSYVVTCTILLCFMVVSLINELELVAKTPLHIIGLCVLLFTVYCFSATCLIFIAIYHKHNLKSPTAIYLYHLMNKPMAREINTSVITLSHGLCFFLARHLAQPRYPDSIESTLATIGLHTILVNCIPMSSSSCVRVLCACTNALLVFSTINCLPTPSYSSKDVTFSDQLTGLECDASLFIRAFSNDSLTLGLPWGKFCTLYTVELGVCAGLVWLLGRDSEYTYRLCFYVSREADVVSCESEKTVDEARELLYNIVPPYVIERIQANSHFSGYQRRLQGSRSAKFSYAVAIPQAGVAFATISNFFASYYREDYRGGETALKLLNRIICMFDDLVSRPEMKDVEKIKTINDCYMVASGLNSDETSKNKSALDHLVALMDFCHLIIESLDDFNNQFIVGSDNFEVKIGFNVGPIIAGIIGVSKPMYDIWGNTVNVASRMYSTGQAGKIQTPLHVAQLLSESFDFTYRGTVFVKGKGDMETYFVSRLETE